jgi:transposase-like protein
MNTTTTEPRYTLAEIAESHGVKKRAAQLWLSKAKTEHGELGEMRGKTRYYSEAEREILLSYAGEPRRQEPTTAAPAEPVESRQLEAAPVDVEILEGNHRSIVPSPVMTGAVDLSRWRGSIEVRRYSDPLGPAESAIQLCAAVNEAIDADLNRSFGELESTLEAVAKAEQAVKQTEAKALEYQVTQSILARLQNEATGRLSALLGNVQGLTGQ